MATNHFVLIEATPTSLTGRALTTNETVIDRFRLRTGCPVIVNTSFNVRGEPIVCTPEDAFRCFMGTEIEALAIGGCFLRKEEQNPALKQNYETSFELD